MKKAIIALLCGGLILSTCITASAAGSDDGKLLVAERNEKKFFGTEIGESGVKYLAANGSGEIFFDLTGDRDMDICDLVALAKEETDLDQSGEYGSSDAAMLRSLIIKG